MINKRWPFIIAIVVLSALAVAETVRARMCDERLTQLREERDHICMSIERHLDVIVEGRGDTRLQDLHAYARWRFGDEAINRACVRNPQPVDLDDGGMCFALGKAGENCFLKPLRELHELYSKQPWRSR